MELIQAELDTMIDDLYHVCWVLGRIKPRISRLRNKASEPSAALERAAGDIHAAETTITQLLRMFQEEV